MKNTNFSPKIDVPEFEGKSNRHYEDEWEDDTPPHPREVGRFRWRGRDHYEKHSNFSPKIDVPKFEGKSNVDDFPEWLNTIERVFEFHEPPETKKVKLVAIKLRRNASF